MFFADTYITAFNRYLAVTNGREKLCRLVQYFARFYAFYLLHTDCSSVTIQRWTELRRHLGTSRKFFRLLKPVEFAQSSFKSLSLIDPILKATQFTKFASGFFYLISESLSLADTINFYNFQNAKNFSEFGLKCWFVSLVASIVSGVYQFKQFKDRAQSLKKVVEKDDTMMEQKKLLRQEKATIHQLFQDLVDIVIPLGGLKWLNFDDGIIGIAGMITSAMAMNTQWKKTNPPV